MKQIDGKWYYDTVEIDGTHPVTPLPPDTVIGNNTTAEAPPQALTFPHLTTTVEPIVASSTQNVTGRNTVGTLIKVILANIAYVLNPKPADTVFANAGTTDGIMKDIATGDLNTTVLAPAASDTQLTAGRKTLGSIIKTFADNIANLFNVTFHDGRYSSGTTLVHVLQFTKMQTVNNFPDSYRIRMTLCEVDILQDVIDFTICISYNKAWYIKQNSARDYGEWKFYICYTAETPDLPGSLSIYIDNTYRRARRYTVTMTPECKYNPINISIPNNVVADVVTLQATYPIVTEWTTTRFNAPTAGDVTPDANVEYPYTTKLRKEGNMVWFNPERLKCLVAMAAYSQVNIGTLPAGFRPARPIVIPCNTTLGSAAYPPRGFASIYVSDNGQMSIFVGEIAVPVNSLIFFNLVFSVAP